MSSPSRAIHRVSAFAALTLSALLGCGGVPEIDGGPPTDGGAADAYVARDGGEASDAALDGGRDAGSASEKDSGTDGGPPPNAPPEGTIDAPAAAHAIVVGESVVFEASCADPDGVPAGHAWDFGGGAPGSAEEDPGALTFAAAGSFEVTYTCTDELGLADPTPARVTVEVVEGSRAWVPIVGDLFTSGERSVGLVDVSGVGGPVMRGPFAGSWPAGLRVTTSHRAARLSANGQRLAFLADDGVTGVNLYALDLSDRPPTAVALTTTGRVADFIWAPDGNKIAYTVSVDDRVEQLVADISAGVGAALVMRTHDPTGPGIVVGGRGTQPDWAWSADSTKLYFTAELSGNHVHEAFMFDVDDPTALAQRLHPPGDGVYDGVYSVYSAGDHIALVVGAMSDSRRVDIHAVDTRIRPFAPVRLNPIIQSWGVEGVQWRYVNSVLVSSDGTRVLFEADLDGSYPELYFADLSGGVPATPGTAQPLGTSGFHFAWSPGGHRAVYFAPGARGWIDQHLFVSDLSGPSATTPRDLSPLPQFFHGAVQRSWLPDGSGVVFSAPTVDPEIRDLFYVALDGSSGAARLSRATTERGVRARRFSWLSPTEVVYAAALESSVIDLYLSDVTAPGISIRLNAPIDPSTGAEGCGDRPRRIDGRRFVAICSWRSAVPEAVLIDADTPGTTVPLHPPLPAGDPVGVVEIPGQEWADWWSGWGL